METKTGKHILNTDNQHKADRVAITYYTDPLCCWSWALEPQWRRLQFQFGNYITWEYKMGGLLPDWKHYHDTEHAVSKPVQMGPVWMHAAQISGMPVQHSVWMQDPPASSYPACIAYNCAALQSKKAAEIFLRLLREAIMIDGKNIAEKNVLMEVAQAVQSYHQEFDITQFAADLVNEKGIEAFRKDLLETQAKGIDRFPTLIFRKNGKSFLMKGYQPFQQLAALVLQFYPGETISINEHPIANSFNWLQLTPREKEELSLSHDVATT